MDTVGWVYFKNGKYNEAESVLADVVNANPDVAVFNYHYGMALYKNGHADDAKKHLEKAVGSESLFSGKDIAEQTLKNMQS